MDKFRTGGEDINIEMCGDCMGKGHFYSATCIFCNGIGLKGVEQ